MGDLERLERGAPLAELRAGLRLVGRGARAAGGRNDDGREDADDRDHREQFDESEAGLGSRSSFRLEAESDPILPPAGGTTSRSRPRKSKGERHFCLSIETHRKM